MARFIASRVKIVWLAIVLLLLGACANPKPTVQPAASPTSAATEVISTQAPSPTPQPTHTPLPTVTQTATITPSPSPTPTPAGGGGLIAFTSIRPGSKYASPKSDIVVFNPGSGSLTWLTKDDLGAVREFPSWSPAGDQLVYTRDNSLYTLNKDGEQEVVTPFGSGIYHPSWSSKDEILVIYSPQKKYPQIWTAPRDTLEWMAITPELAFQYDPVWSPDGQTYAFSGAPGTIVSQWVNSIFGGFQFTYYDVKPRDIFLVDAASGQMTQVTTGPEDDFQPAWSPDGQKLAFVSIQDIKNPDIFTINRDGSDLQRLTTNTAQDIYPSWSPDGKMIAFSSDRFGNFEIYLMQQNGQNQVRLTANVMDDFQPAWSAAEPEGIGLSDEAATLGGDLSKFRPNLLKMVDVVGWLHQAGLISTIKGKENSLDAFNESWAQINWYSYFPTGFAPRDFVIRTNARWKSASDKANWFSSGCGFVFREEDTDNHYMIYLAMDGFVYLSRYKNGFYSNLGRSTARYPLDTPEDGANLMLAVEGDTIQFLVNGLLVFTKHDSTFNTGRLAYTLNSGTNKDFGTRCQMDSVELWTITP